MKLKASKSDVTELPSSRAAPSKSDLVGRQSKASQSLSEEVAATKAGRGLAGKREPVTTAHLHRSDPLTEKFFSVDEVAEILNVSCRTVRRWIAGKKLIAHALEGIIRVSDRDLRTFIALSRRL